MYCILVLNIYEMLAECLLQTPGERKRGVVRLSNELPMRCTESGVLSEHNQHRAANTDVLQYRWFLQSNTHTHITVQQVV